MNGGGSRLSNKALIIGAGFLGKKIQSVFSHAGFDISATTLSGKNSIQLDITKKECVESVLSKEEPFLVILAGGLAGVDYCEKNPEQAMKVNAQGTRNVAQACSSIGAEFFFVSTDYVFDGKKGNYSEGDSTNPINAYGESKLAGEKAVQQELSPKEYLIMRVSTLYGYNSENDKNTFVRFAVRQLREGKEVLAAPQITAPTLIDDAANALLEFHKKNCSGIYHVSGKDALSRSEQARKIAEVFSLSPEPIKEVKTIPGWTAARPSNSSFSLKKALSEGIHLSTFEEGLKKLRNYY
jgi:dTDP-4-dehydrorhamnose reductase